MAAHSGIVPLPSNRLPSFTSCGGFPSSRNAFWIKKRAFGNAMPFPHIAYSAARLCSPSCHRINASLLFSPSARRMTCFGLVFLISQLLAYTSRQKSNSFGFFSDSISAHPSGNPCNRLHSSGINRRTIQSGCSLSSQTTVSEPPPNAPPDFLSVPLTSSSM